MCQTATSDAEEVAKVPQLFMTLVKAPSNKGFSPRLILNNFCLMIIGLDFPKTFILNDSRSAC
jgi:hypothetical protein